MKERRPQESDESEKQPMKLDGDLGGTPVHKLILPIHHRY